MKHLEVSKNDINSIMQLYITNVKEKYLKCLQLNAV